VALANREAGITLRGYIGHGDVSRLPMSEAEQTNFAFIDG